MSDSTTANKVRIRQGGDALCIADGGQILIEGGASALGHSPLIWDDCPKLQMLADPTLGVYVHDDMTVIGPTTNRWSISGTNGTFLPLAGAGYGVGRLATAGADNDECYAAFNNAAAGLIKACADKQWWFEAAVKVSQITLAQGVFVGLAEEGGAVGADFMTDNTMALKVLDWIGFQVIQAVDAAAVWQTVMAINGGARVAVAASAANAAVAWAKLGMKSVPNSAGTAATVTFYLNGVALAATVLSSATNFPLDQYLLPVFATKAGQATANTLDVDWWTAAQLR